VAAAARPVAPFPTMLLAPSGITAATFSIERTSATMNQIVG